MAPLHLQCLCFRAPISQGGGWTPEQGAQETAPLPVNATGTGWWGLKTPVTQIPK